MGLNNLKFCACVKLLFFRSRRYGTVENQFILLFLTA